MQLINSFKTLLIPYLFSNFLFISVYCILFLLFLILIMTDPSSENSSPHMQISIPETYRMERKEPFRLIIGIF